MSKAYTVPDDHVPTIENALDAVDDEVEPGLVMEWGGWEDWETFREAYLGTYSTKSKTRAREKVDWL
jgi:hypothetical protein